MRSQATLMMGVEEGMKAYAGVNTHEPSVRHRSLVVYGVLLSCLVHIGGCAKELDDEYYEETINGELLPTDSLNTRGIASRDVSGLPYWRFTLARGFLSSDVTKASRLKFEALYPEMSHFIPSRRDVWLKRNPTGSLGSNVDDVVWVIVEFRPNGNNDAGSEAALSLERSLDKSLIIDIPPAELASKIPNLQMFRYVNERDQRTDFSRSAFVYRQSDERVVTVNSCWKVCWGNTTWRGKFRIRYRFPEARLSEMPELDLAVNRLVDSFQPMLINNGE